MQTRDTSSEPPDPLLVATPRDPVPGGAVAEFLEMADATRIRVARWAPPQTTGTPRGTVVILNGRSEFIEKYFETIESLRARGFTVATLDWRGQGRSDRPLANPHKGHVDDFEAYVSDLHQFHTRWVQPHCPGPYSLLAHSMGGHIALRYLAQNPGGFERAIFSAPMWGIGTRARPSLGMRLPVRLARRLGLSKQYVTLRAASGDFGERNRSFEKSALTHDRERFERVLAQLDADPRLELGAPTFAWVAAALASMHASFAAGFPEAIATPAHVVTAGQDTIVSERAQAELVSRLPRCEHSVLEGSRHEILIESDPYRERFFEIFDAFGV